jgi:hypothetical protein
MNRAHVYNYDSAEKWLQGARAKLKNERSLYQYGMRLVRTNRDSIAVVMQYYGNVQTMITYKSNGDIVLHYPSNYTWQGVRRIFNEYVEGLTMVIRKGRLIISLPVDGKTASKVQRCRSCKGVGTHPRECWGPSNCYDQECEKVIEQEKMRQVLIGMGWSDPGRDKLYEEIGKLIHGHDTCKHGETKRHTAHNDRYTCWRCHGNKTVDYGNKKQGRVWESNVSAIVLSNDGDYKEEICS